MRIDYLSYTFKNADTSSPAFGEWLMSNGDELLPLKVRKYISQHSLEPIFSYCGMGYGMKLFYPNFGVTFMYQGCTPAHGLHIVITGGALLLSGMNHQDFADFRADVLDICLSNFLYRADVENDISFMVSRCDVAFDCETPFKDFYEKFQQGCFLTPLRSSRTILTQGGRGTIYVGSRQSNCYIRIYDKALEQNEKQKCFFGSELDSFENWTRVEFEFKNDSHYKVAENVFRDFCDLGEVETAKWCLKYLYIANEKKYGNERRNTDLWDVYEDLLRQNSYFGQLEKVKKYERANVNVAYLQMVYNLLETYFCKIDGLREYLSALAKPSKGALRKSLNIDLISLLRAETPSEYDYKESEDYLNDEDSEMYWL